VELHDPRYDLRNNHHLADSCSCLRGGMKPRRSNPLSQPTMSAASLIPAPAQCWKWGILDMSHAFFIALLIPSPTRWLLDVVLGKYLSAFARIRQPAVSLRLRRYLPHTTTYSTVPAPCRRCRLNAQTSTPMLHRLGTISSTPHPPPKPTLTASTSILP
jgi:hypothetical protein